MTILFKLPLAVSKLILLLQNEMYVKARNLLIYFLALQKEIFAGKKTLFKKSQNVTSFIGTDF